MRVVAAESDLSAQGMVVALIDPAYRTPHRSMPANGRGEGMTGSPGTFRALLTTIPHRTGETLHHNRIRNLPFRSWPSLR